MEQLTPVAMPPLPDRIRLKLTQKEWNALLWMLLPEGEQAMHTADKYMRAILYPLLRQVCIKLHNRTHSLKAKNILTLTMPEASVLCMTLQEASESNYLVIDIINQIDKKLT